MSMSRRLRGISAAACALLSVTGGWTAFAQAPGAGARTEFEAASIRVNPPVTGFHSAAESSSGGPGTVDPGRFRCSNCTLATLIGKAFQLQNYQFPARTSVSEHTFEVAAKIPAGTNPEEFQAMLQNLLKERFGLAYHFTEKKMRGYQLVVARSGSKLKESNDNPRPAAADNPDNHGQRRDSDQHQFGRGGGDGHNGLVIFGGFARYRGDHQTTADLARLCSDQLSLPVNDQTGLTGQYDVSLTWSGNVAHSGNHADGGLGGGGHTDHAGGSPAGPVGSETNQGERSGPNLFDAVQAQLGLRLVAAEQAVARIFVIDHAERLPTAN